MCRIKAGGHHFESATFELCLHAMFCSFGAKISVHPQTENDSDRRPDFLVTLPSDFSFYLEAVLTQGFTNQEDGIQKRLHELYDAINRKFVSTQFFWSVSVESVGSNAASSSGVVSALNNHMNDLAHADVKEAQERSDFQSHSFHYRNAGWSLRFTPFPKKAPSFDKNQEAIGITGWKSAEICTDDADLVATISSKTKHHKDLEKPYVVAVNAQRYSVRENDFLDALYGKQAMRFSQCPDGTTNCIEVRSPNGVWCGPGGKRNNNLIAVLGISQWSPWAKPSMGFVAYENPYIDYPKAWRLSDLAGFSAGENETLVKREGKCLGDLFELPPDWPFWS